MTRRRGWGAWGLAAAGSLALAACGHSPPTTFYSLDPAPPSGPRVAGPVAPVKVQAVHLPPEFDRPQLITRGADGRRLQVHETSQWAGPVGALARNALILDLAARLPAGSVIAPDAPRPANARLLTVDVLEVAPAAGQLRMTAVWTLSAPPPLKGPPPAAVSRTETLGVSLGAANNPASEADALTRLIGALADRISPGLAG